MSSGGSLHLQDDSAVPVEPIVSVIIPAYNAAKFLPETLDSIRRQTQEGIEVILVDDGSTDETSVVAASFGSWVRVIRQENQGVSAARNRGLIDARGRYVCFLDADDWMYPESLHLKAQLLQQDPTIGLAIGWVEVTGPHLEASGTVLKGSEGDVLRDLLLLIPPAIPCPSNVLLRKEVLDVVGGFDEELGTSADFDLWLRIAQRYRVGRVEQVLMKYRRHDAAMFRDIEAQVRDVERIFQKHRDTLGKRAEWRILKWRFYRSVAGGYLHRGRLWKAVPPLVKGLISAGWLASWRLRIA